MHAARFLLLLSLVAAACSSSSPVPSPAGRTTGVLPDLMVSASCHRVEDTKRLAVAITNLGKLAAAPSATRVEFESDPADSFVRMTRAIAVRSVETFELDLPPACYRDDCRWKITADAAGQVIESDETNNTAAGRC